MEHDVAPKATDDHRTEQHQKLLQHKVSNNQQSFTRAEGIVHTRSHRYTVMHRRPRAAMQIKEG